MSRRLLLVLALGAALVGAPSRVSAASNVLLGGQVSPTSGTTATTFTFSVRYEGRFAATAVTATAGATAVSLSRVGGTPTDGTWRGSSRLPAGTWQIAFAAVALQGNPASLTGPAVTVVADAPATAVPSTWESAPASGGTTIDAGASAEATAASPPPAGAADESAAPAPASADGVTASPSSGANVGAHVPVPGQGADTPASSAGGPGALPRASAPVEPSRGAGAPTDETPAASPTMTRPGEATDVGSLALILGLVGLALVAVSGSGLLLVAGRRRRSTAAEGPSIADAEADTVVERRTLRRAHVRLEEDPIVASLGLPDADGAAERRARRAAKRRALR